MLLIASLVFFDVRSANAAVPTAPTITSITPAATQLTVAFTAPATATPAVTNYEYSIDGGLTWVPRSPASTTSPIVITGLSNCTTYPVSIRAVNSDGPGAAAEVWNGVPSAYQYVLNNGLMRFGTGSEASINTAGNLKQAWYNSSGSWFKLSYSSYPLNFAVGVGGDGTNEWNINGSLQEFSSVVLARQTIDCSQFITTSTSGTLATGYGTLTTTGRYTIGGQTVELTRSYTQTVDSKYTKFSESIRNVGSSTMSNARVWVGTQDDWIANSDVTTKKRGNISSGVFSQIPTQSTQARALEISSGTDTVYFYTTSNLGYVTGLNGYGAFQTQVMNLNPSSALITNTNDGSYGMYLRFQDIAPGASESFNWFYVATTTATAAATLATVSSAALPGQPTIDSVTPGNTTATVNFTPGASGGSTLTNYQYSVDGGTNWITRSPAAITSPLTITGLSNGQSYNVKIRAVNSEGSGTASLASSVTPIGPPQAPQITSLTQTDTSIAVAFNAPSSNGGATITGYEYSVDGGTNWISPSSPVLASPLSITGLTPGTAYLVSIRAVNSQGPGSPSPAQNVTTLTAPDAPHLGAIVASDGALSVEVSFGATGGSPITNVQYSIDGGASWTDRTPASTYTPLLISGLTNGTSYDIAVRAVNAVGHSTASNVVTGKPQTTPDAVSLPLSTVVVPSSHTLTLSFSTPGDGGSSISGYEYSTDRGATWRARTDGGGVGTTLTLDKLSSDGQTLLTNGTEYCVQVRAVNAVGVGPASNDVCSVPKTVPDAPSLLTVVSRDRALDLGFTLGGNGGAPITDLQYCVASCLTTSNWISFGGVASPFRILNLTNGTGYTVKIRAVNSVGAGADATFGTAVTPANNPSAPSNLSVVSGAGQATLSFTAPASDGGIPLSNYEYSLDAGATWIAVSPPSTSTTITVTGLTNGTNYGFAVRGVTASTTGQSSVVSYATPSTTPSAPISAVFTPLSGRIGVSFTAPSDGGSPITTYQYALSTNGGTTYGSWTSTNTITSSFSISGVTNGTAYFVKVRAVNLNGGGAAAVTASAITPAGVPESPVITGVSNSGTLLSLTDRQLAVYFTEPANNGSTITNYQYSTDNGLTWLNRTDATGRFSPLVISKLSSDGTTDLSIGTTYSVLIRAVNGNGSGAASQVTSATTGGFVDVIPPTMTLTPSTTSSTSRTLTYSAVFSENISGLVTSDFTFGTGTSLCSVSSLSAGSGTTITVTVTCTRDGTVALRLGANTVTDGTNFGPVAMVSATVVTINTVVPQATLSVSSSTSNSRTLIYTADFSTNVSGVATTDLVKASGTASCTTTAVSASSGTTVTFTVTCSTDGTVTMRLSANSVTNGFSSGPTLAVTAAEVTIDSVVPTATISSPALRSASRSNSYVVTFSELVSGLAASDFIQTAGTASCTTTSLSSSSGTVITFTVTCADDGTVQMSLVAGAATDGVNLTPAFGIVSSTTTIDQTPPSAVIASPFPVVRSRTLSYTVTFSEFVSGISINDFVQSGGSATCTTTSVSQATGTSATFTVDCVSDGTVVMKLAAQSVSDGLYSGPVSEVLSREVTVQTIIPQVVVPRVSTPSISPTPSSAPRTPTYLSNGELPRVVSSTPLVLIGGQQTSVTPQALPSGGQQIVLPAGMSVLIESTNSTPATSSNNLPVPGAIQVRTGESIQIRASGLLPGSEVVVWLFSTPRMLGAVIVAADGTVAAQFSVPTDVPRGAHTAQVDAVDATATDVSVNAAVHLSDEAAATVVSEPDGTITTVFALVAAGVLALVALLLILLLARRSRRQS